MKLKDLIKRLQNMETFVGGDANIWCDYVGPDVCGEPIAVSFEIHDLERSRQGNVVLKAEKL